MPLILFKDIMLQGLCKHENLYPKRIYYKGYEVRLCKLYVTMQQGLGLLKKLQTLALQT